MSSRWSEPPQVSLLVSFIWPLVGSHGPRGRVRWGLGMGQEAPGKEGGTSSDLGWAASGSFFIISGMADSKACHYRLMQLFGVTAWGWGTAAQGSCGGTRERPSHPFLWNRQSDFQGLFLFLQLVKIGREIPVLSLNMSTQSDLAKSIYFIGIVL